MTDQFAFDRSSVRRIDEDGHLHVDRAAISKAMVCPYYGSEIPNSQRLGLAANRIYHLLRDPKELTRAADTFDGKPLLDGVHQPQLAGDHAHDLVAGAVNNVRWEPPYLTAELVVWPAGAIDAVQTGARRELSASYRYDADMTPGTFQGTRYDGIMRNIRGNHVILCETGRAGPDVFVGDSAINREEPRVTFATDHRPLRATTMQDFQALRVAERECAALVPNAIAMDSADQIYCAALTRMGVDSRNVRELGRYLGAAAVVFRARVRHGATAPRSTAGDLKGRAERFPNAGRLY